MKRKIHKKIQCNLKIWWQHARYNEIWQSTIPIVLLLFSLCHFKIKSRHPDLPSGNPWNLKVLGSNSARSLPWGKKISDLCGTWPGSSPKVGHIFPMEGIWRDLNPGPLDSRGWRGGLDVSGFRRIHNFVNAIAHHHAKPIWRLAILYHPVERATAHERGTVTSRWYLHIKWSGRMVYFPLILHT